MATRWRGRTVAKVDLPVEESPSAAPALYATTASPAFPVPLFAAAWNGRPFAPLSHRPAGVVAAEGLL
ncbi:hypothetical protein ETD86_27475 [Nonomuraea turkmeniaca]|uniref:Uncharacterized protein n=1 Tax=Nonomuraea turkmeniaca TaxID=103838 RepID=A0A5S4FCU8_9ACTN|nr:hypothetical protein [Nonomuraea turkmeniaca]TMR15291.1 hypothetical protein ETD86_27475 [Nonomuraea turkmeniaca]